MRCERFALPAGGDPAAAAAHVRDLVPSPRSVQDAVSEIIAQVRAGGDEAVHEYSRRFDTGGTEPLALELTEAELDHAAAALDRAIAHGLLRAIENVGAVAHAAQREPEIALDLGSHRVAVRSAPVDRAAVYVPGGRAPYPSTVVMGVVTARAAGVTDVAVCAPPGATGDIDPVVLAACKLTQATSVYRMGGAQAIAALAYGTETVTPVDVIVGPGNLYVQEAKRQVFGHVGIDGFAGPSDLLLIADGGSDTGPLALDLLAQAEHGPGTLVVALSTSQRLLGDLQARLDPAPDTAAVACLINADDHEQALAFAQAFAPEHIQLVGLHAEALAARVTHAGCVFVGPQAGTAFGDYIAGSNHILPTNGAARYASSLSPLHFTRSFTEVRIADPGELARAAAPVARAEGFAVHAESMEARIRDNGE
ncbi:MAG TPA: histidinol dehydrogenase [Solirubrobacteraceae bacterium]|nr:histidinol dehydrogenase [Solirubrobacteraceae bacterium]